MAIFFFNDTATTEIYTLSLHDALPISRRPRRGGRVRAEERRHEVPQGGDRPLRRRPPRRQRARRAAGAARVGGRARDRKSTRLNSSHANISYAVFCLKKKN